MIVIIYDYIIFLLYLYKIIAYLVSKRDFVKGVIEWKIPFSSCLNINVCWKCVYTSTL